jgi:predicted PurR-regulated permease PerM
MVFFDAQSVQPKAMAPAEQPAGPLRAARGLRFAAGVTPTVLFIRHAPIVIALAAMTLALWRIAYALLLAFGGLLLAVLLRGLARNVARWTPLVAFAGPPIADQASELAQALPQGVHRIGEDLQRSHWGKLLVELAAQGVQDGEHLVGALRHVVIGGFDAAVGLVLVFFAGIYFAATPQVYSEGLVRLFPRPRQARVREVLGATHDALWHWLIGQLVLMAIVGTLAAVGLYLIGVPLALVLGLIAGLLEFIPFVGPILAAVPILLVALTAGAETALYAGLLFLAIQQAENHLLVPLVQRVAVELPPVLVLVSAVGFALIFGILGAIFATPLLVVAVVWVKMLYMHDTLREAAP